jgi:hypothetical protein
MHSRLTLKQKYKENKFTVWLKGPEIGRPLVSQGMAPVPGMPQSPLFSLPVGGARMGKIP